MVYLLVGSQISLIAVLSIAAIGKIVNPRQLIIAIEASQINKKLAYPIAITTIVIEVEIVFNMIFSTSYSLPLVFLGTFLLLCIFTGWLFYVYHRKLHIACGCFGNSKGTIDRGSVTRNIVLIAISLLGLSLSFLVVSPLPHPSLNTFVINLVLVGCVLFLVSRHSVKLHRENALRGIPQA